MLAKQEYGGYAFVSASALPRGDSEFPGTVQTMARGVEDPSIC